MTSGGPRWVMGPPQAAFDPAAVITACQAAIKDGRATARTITRLLNTLFQAGQFAEGLDLAARHAPAPGVDPALDVAVLHLLLGAGCAGEALDRAEAALRVAPDHADLALERAEILIRLRRNAEAEAATLAILDRGDRALTPRMTELLAARLDPGRLLALLEDRPDGFLIADGAWARIACLLALGRAEEAAPWMDTDRLLRHERLSPPDGGDAARFHAAVIAEAMATGSTQREPFDKATRLGLQTGLTPGRAGPLSALLAAIRARIDAYADALPPGHPVAHLAPRAAFLTAWMVQLGPGGHQAPHRHPMAWISGVYYLATPAVDATDGTLIVPSSADPRWPSRVLVPEPGALVLFPSYFPHATSPHRGPDDRVSLAFDARPWTGPA